MNKFYLKICTTLLIYGVASNTSFAEPSCYMNLRSLTLSVNVDKKKVCADKKLEPAPAKMDAYTSNEELDESPVDIDTFFAYPHIENKEKTPTADGAGVEISVDF